MFLIGYESGPESTFGFQDPPAPSCQPISFDGDEPICIIAPTGSGKSRDLVVPNILHHDGPLIVTDMKGELAEVCARRRLELGHEVAVLDPFHKTRFESARLDPLDMLSLPGAMLEADAEMVASLLTPIQQFEKDPFWNAQAGSLVSGLLVAIKTVNGAEERDITTLTDYLFGDDVTYNLAVLLDKKGGEMPKFAYKAIAAFLQSSERDTRPSILNTAQNFVRCLGSEDVARCVKDSTIKLKDIIEGKPLDIFICIPPDKLKSHAGLFRLWVAAFMTAIMCRTEIPEKKTLLLVDECAQLGTFEPILTASTLLRGYGLQLVTVWQDIAQIKSRYKEDWPTILNNAAALIAFGQGHYSAAKEYSEVLGVPPHELMKLGRDQAILSVRGEGSRVIRRMNYLVDPRFAGMADENPFFSRRKAM